jgi:hypothetical protein
VERDRRNNTYSLVVFLYFLCLCISSMDMYGIDVYSMVVRGVLHIGVHSVSVHGMGVNGVYS